MKLLKHNSLKPAECVSGDTCVWPDLSFANESNDWIEAKGARDEAKRGAGVLKRFGGNPSH